MNISDFDHKKILTRAIAVLAILAVALFLFAAGVTVGSRKARFDERYWRPGAESGGPARMFPDIPGGHGASGTVVSVSPAGFVIASPDKSEKVVLVNASSTIRRFRGDASSTDVKVGDSVVVIGSPDDKGDIDASLVRIIPQ